MWQEPKTNWVSDDYININDYNRIIGNLSYLSELEKELYSPISIDELSEKAVDEFPYANEFNSIESFLDGLSSDTFPFLSYVRGYWIDNGPTPTYNDMNRIENACLAFYKGYNRQKLTRPKLSMTLGRKQSVIKC